MLKSLFYLSAGSSRWGTGHLRRSLEVIETLRSRGVNLHTVALVPESAEMQKLYVFVKDYDRRVQSLEEIGRIDADGIVVDVNTDFQPELFPWLQKQKFSVVGLDWYHETGGVVVASANLRGGESALKYAIIRKEFHHAFQNHSGQRPEYDVVVMMGGGDSRGHLHKIFGFFTVDDRFSDRSIAIVLGPMVEGKLSEFIDRPIGKVAVLKNPDNIADVMANTLIGITNGGTSLMEFTMLGVPTLIFPQSEEEDNFVQPFLESSCSVLGANEYGEFARQITELLENEILRKTMAEKAKKLIDGHGARRITDIILKTFAF